MTMHDSSPERRNLNVLSISIILFHFAEGKVLNGQLKLSMLNVEFAKTEVLQYSIVVFLLWFLLRYWVVEKEAASKEHSQEIAQLNVSDLYKKYIDKESGHNIVRLYHSPRTEYPAHLMTAAERGSFGGIKIRVLVFIRLLLTQPTLSGYYLAYFLGLGALYIIAPVVLVLWLSLVVIAKTLADDTDFYFSFNFIIQSIVTTGVFVTIYFFYKQF